MIAGLSGRKNLFRLIERVQAASPRTSVGLSIYRYIAWPLQEKKGQHGRIVFFS
jgi:hypothetical protein